jgi:hypothetical protein
VISEDEADEIVQSLAEGMRYRLPHAAACLVRGGRRRILKIAANWPWTGQITTAWERIHAIRHPL